MISASKSKPVILTLVGYYLPGYKAGGPLRSIENLVAALGKELQFKIVTLDRDLGDERPYPEVVANHWTKVGNAEVMYVEPGMRGLTQVWALLRAVDRESVVYINSYFDRRFSMLPMMMRWFRLCHPRAFVLAPRGEFSPGALAIKRTRKLCYLGLSRFLGLHRRIIWHASTGLEAADIRRLYPGTEESEIDSVVSRTHTAQKKGTYSVLLTAMDIATAGGPLAGKRQPKKCGEFRVVFVSRISRMKNLAGALEILKGVSGNISFDIFGPAEDAEYWAECQQLINALPPNIRVRYCGQLAHKLINRVFMEHDLFLFPTLGENFGHVISESLSAGCPVLTSDQVPWQDLEAQGAGWAIPLDAPERFQSVLQMCADKDENWHAALSARALEYAKSRMSGQVSINAHRSLFHEALCALAH